jgi:hypothetical protein
MCYTIYMDDLFDPSYIANLFRAKLNLECDEARKILDSLEHCTHPVARCSCGCEDPYFVDPEGPDWHFRGNITAWDNGTLYVLDIMENWTVGSIEMQKDFPMPLEAMVPVDLD